METLNRPMRYLFTSVILLLPSLGQAQLTSQSLFFKLTGKPLLQRHPRAADWQQQIARGDIVTAATQMSEDDGFVDNVAHAWVQRYLLADKGTVLSLNDASASLLGIIRDETDVREFLTGDFTYGARSRLALGRPSLRSNVSFDALRERGLSLKSNIERYSPQWEASIQERSGVLSSRWFGEMNYQAGTNRRAVKASLETFLCRPIEEWKTPNLSTSWIRRDVPRAPNGDPRVFQTECRSCHGPMDAMAGAFAHLDYAADTLRWSHAVAAKNNNLPQVYPEGRVVNDARWKNLLVHRSELGFDGAETVEGTGVADFGRMLASSDGFSRCLAKRTVKHFCSRDLPLQNTWVVELAESLSGPLNYNLRKLFIAVVTHPRCQE